MEQLWHDLITHLRTNAVALSIKPTSIDGGVASPTNEMRVQPPFILVYLIPGNGDNDSTGFPSAYRINIAIAVSGAAHNTTLKSVSDSFTRSIAVLKTLKDFYPPSLIDEGQHVQFEHDPIELVEHYSNISVHIVKAWIPFPLT